LGGAPAEGQGGGAIGVAVGAGGGAVADLAVDGDDALDGGQVIANVATDGDDDLPLFEGGAQAGVELGFQGRGEGAEFEAGDAAAKLFDEVVAKADTGTGVIDSDFAAALEARPEFFDLIGSGSVAEGQDFAGDE
jgi:hypothetical protein